MAKTRPEGRLFPRPSRLAAIVGGLATGLLPIASAHAMASMVMDVGHVHLETSCATAASAEIDRGVSLLYAFWYDAARRSFEQAAAAQPGCAMACWGQAMADWQPIESLPQNVMAEAGRKAVARAAAAAIATARERAYVDAVGIIFDATPARGSAARVAGFSNAMGSIAATYPRDRQAAVLEALTLLSPELPEDPRLVRARRALSILERVLKAEPDNPGVAHFIIHATDNPRMARLGLAAARRYAAMAPASAHAQHMPSHIFARLGRWRDDIRSNLDSLTAAEQPAVAHQAQDRLHALEFLQYAYLQLGRDRLASAMAVKAANIRPDELSPGFEAYYDFAEEGFRARQALETRNWYTARALRPLPGDSSRGRRVIYWAQAVGAGHLRDAAAADAARARFEATYSPDERIAARSNPSAAWLEVQAWALSTQGRTDAAVARLRRKADEQDAIGKGEVEPPAREMIGDMLRLAGCRAEALTQYRRSLKTDPGRLGTLRSVRELGGG